MLRKIWVALLLAASVLPRAHAVVMTAEGVENRIIVAYAPGVSDAEQRKNAQSKGLKVIAEIPSIRVLLVEARPGFAQAASEQLGADPKVLKTQKDVWLNWLNSEPATFAQTPLPSFEAVAGQLKLRERAPRASDAADDAPWGVKRVNAPAAWATNQGSGVKVAVVDTGIDPTHPKLAGRVAGGYNAVDKNAPWADDHFHGTHVAGTIAADLDGKPIVGVAPKATLYAVKVLTKEGSGNLFAIMDGIMWCAQNGIKVINMSLGAPQEMPLLQYALQMANQAGVTIVAAAGNDGKAVNWPAAYPESIAVSAMCPTGVTNAKLCTSAEEGIAAFSSRGPQVAFIAPGVLIPSTVPTSNDASGVHAYSGTSMACPHVAGLAALAVAKGASTPDAVRAALKAAATPLPGLSANEQGAGLVNAAKLAK